MPRPFLTATWRHLLMLNYEVDPALLRPFVPRGTEIDFWQGRTFVSVVGFEFLHTRVRGLAIPGHQNFPEINLRFYIKREDERGVQRGVGFIQELVPRLAIALVARWVYNEKYQALPMRADVRPPRLPQQEAGSVSYGWKSRGQWHTIGADIEGEPSPMMLNSEPWFIAEHYWGYARQRNGSTVEYQVEHPPWRVWLPTRVHIDPGLRSHYPAAFADTLRQSPSSVFVAEGSEVNVYPGRLLHEG